MCVDLLHGSRLRDRGSLCSKYRTYASSEFANLKLVAPGAVLQIGARSGVAGDIAMSKLGAPNFKFEDSLEAYVRYLAQRKPADRMQRLHFPPADDAIRASAKYKHLSLYLHRRTF